MACFREERNEEVERKRLTMRVITGAKTCNALFKSLVGIGLRVQNLLEASLLIRAKTSSVDRVDRENSRTL
jgi:hypothetical protein